MKFKSERECNTSATKHDGTLPIFIVFKDNKYYLSIPELHVYVVSENLESAYKNLELEKTKHYQARSLFEKVYNELGIISQDDSPFVCKAKKFFMELRDRFYSTLLTFICFFILLFLLYFAIGFFSNTKPTTYVKWYIKAKVIPLLKSNELQK